MRTRVPKTRRTWLLIALCVVLSLVITLLEARGRPSRPSVPVPEPAPNAEAPAPDEAPSPAFVEFEVSE